MSSFGNNTAPQASPTPSTNGPHFHGPPHSSGGIITLYNPHTLTQQPIFNLSISKHPKEHMILTRIHPNSQTSPLATAPLASLSSSITVNIHNQQIEMATDAKDGSRVFSALGMDLRWKLKGSGTGYKLLDSQKRELAVLKLCNSDGTGGRELLLLGAWGDAYVEVVVATGFAMMMKEDKEGKQAFKFLKRVLGSV